MTFLFEELAHVREEAAVEAPVRVRSKGPHDLVAPVGVTSEPKKVRELLVQDEHVFPFRPEQLLRELLTLFFYLSHILIGLEDTRFSDLRQLGRVLVEGDTELLFIGLEDLRVQAVAVVVLQVLHGVI